MSGFEQDPTRPTSILIEGTPAKWASSEGAARRSGAPDRVQRFPDRWRRSGLRLDLTGQFGKHVGWDGHGEDAVLGVELAGAS